MEILKSGAAVVAALHVAAEEAAADNNVDVALAVAADAAAKEGHGS